MSLYVLDTDTVSLFRKGHPRVVERVATCPVEALAVTVITVEEYLTGWYSLIRRARRVEQLELAYRELAQAPNFLATFHIVAYSQSAMTRFESLVKQKLNIGNMDLRIAAIVLEVGATLISRNLRDFVRIPGLTVEDWSAPVASGDVSETNVLS